uniref:Transcription factor Iwr1 domain-containing protein n=1 Tax=Oryza nivara TaxID=4536 RepID=A0A0E0G409_ORYNI
MTPWNTDSDSDSDTRKKPIWRTYIFEFLSSHLLQPLAPASTCAQVLDQQLAPHHGSRHPAPPSLHDLNADPPAEDDNHIVHLHGEPLPQPPYFPEPKPPPTSTVVEAVAVAVVAAAAAASPATCHYIWRLIQAIKPLLTIGQRNNRQASPLDPAPPSLRDLNADPPAEDDDHIVHLHGEPLPQPPYFPEPNAAADLDGGLDGDAEASFPGSNPEADGRELDGDLEQDHSLFMFLDPGEVRCRKRLRASEEDDVDVGDARGAPGRCYDDDVAEDGRSTQSRYSWRPRKLHARRRHAGGEQIAADDTYYDSYYYMDGEYGGAYDEEEHQQDDMEAADFHDGNQLSPEHQRVLDRLFGEADGSTRQEEQEAAAQGSGGEHVPPEEDSYEAAAVLAGDDVDEEQLQRQEQVDMTDGTDETF